ncbi:anionic trypsin-2-like isoform X2 [Tubulanus polymorphus]|uniref:anionic trypsin-2-like isoform X1 n=1 Tax=Tubulanus polymorphus TaxID=672921 RepID=UPI003DA27231
MRAILTCIIAFCCILAAPVAGADDGDWRIIGGKEIASEDMDSWVVSLRGKFTTASVVGVPLLKKTWTCGGSLINDRWILTAAHCFVHNKYDLDDPKGWTASTKLSSGVIGTIKGWLGKALKKDNRVEWDMDVEKIILHPRYFIRRGQWENDIALVKLKKPVPAEKRFFFKASIKLPGTSPSFPEPGQSCVMKGRGCTADGKSVTSKAREIRLPITTGRDCFSQRGVDTAINLCAGYEFDIGVGICEADSGGPLVCHTGHEWVQVGIALSPGVPGAQSAVFTRVSNYVDWINSTISSN